MWRERLTHGIFPGKGLGGEALEDGGRLWRIYLLKGYSSFFYAPSTIFRCRARPWPPLPPPPPPPRPPPARRGSLRASDSPNPPRSAPPTQGCFLFSFWGEKLIEETLEFRCIIFFGQIYPVYIEVPPCHLTPIISRFFKFQKIHFQRIEGHENTL